MIFSRCDVKRFDLVSSTMCGLRSDEQEKNSEHRWSLSLSLRICIIICVRVTWYTQMVIRGSSCWFKPWHCCIICYRQKFWNLFCACCALSISSYTIFAFANGFFAICFFACFAVSISSYQLPAFVQLLSTAQLVKVGGEGEETGLWGGDHLVCETWISAPKHFTNNFADIFALNN